MKQTEQKCTLTYYEGELGRGAFGVVYKAMLWERVGIEVFSTEISKRKLLSSKTEPQVVAVQVLLGETKNEINARPYKSVIYRFSQG